MHGLECTDCYKNMNASKNHGLQSEASINLSEQSNDINVQQRIYMCPSLFDFAQRQDQYVKSKQQQGILRVQFLDRFILHRCHSRGVGNRHTVFSRRSDMF
jgi:hypothetical protein